jgi:hypothetical protein
MRTGLKHRLGAAVAGALFVCSPHLGATTYNVVINSTGFSTSDATLAFDFTDGGPPHNTVTLSALTSNGTQGAPSISGSITGMGPWIFADASGFSELLVPFSPLGTSMSFSFSTTDNAPAGGSFPDEFAFFVLDSDAVFPLVTTNEPLGSDALFIVDISGLGAGGLNVYTPESGYSIDVRPITQAPEPASLALLAAGFVAFSLRKRYKQ